MTKITIYEYKSYEDNALAKFTANKDLKISTFAEPLSMQNINLAAGSDGVITLTGSPITAEVAAKFAEMGIKHYATRTIGFNHVDLAALKKHGISASHARYAPDNLAEFTITLMLMHLKKLKASIFNSLEGNYTLDGLMSTELKHQTVGVIGGSGNIGSAVINLLKGFGCNILVYDLFKKDKSINYVDLDTLYAQSDIITLHVPASKENYHLISEKNIAKLKKAPLIVNISRGEIINTADALAALHSGKLSGLALDVVEGEADVIWKKGAPQPAFYKTLQTHKDIIHTPHYAFFSSTAIFDMFKSGIMGIVLSKEGKENVYKINA